MATRVGPAKFCMVPLNRPFRKPLGRPKRLWSLCHTSRLIGDFVQILRSKFWALGGLNQKSKNNVLQSATWRNDGQNGKKWLDSIEKQKRRSILKGRYRQTSGQGEDRQSQLLTIMTPSWARRSISVNMLLDQSWQ